MRVQVERSAGRPTWTRAARSDGAVDAAPARLWHRRLSAGAAGTLLIFDEVITGFRLAYGGAAQRYGVRADLTVPALGLNTVR